MPSRVLFGPCVALVASLLAACDRTPEGPGSTPAVASSAPSSLAPPPQSPQSPSLPAAPADSFASFGQAMMGAEKAIDTGDYSGADRALDAAAAAAAAAGGDAHLLFGVALYRATRFTYSGDIDRAVTALTAVIPELAKHPESSDEFSAHNQMMILRVAQGDPSAALVEDDQATRAAARGTWAPQERVTLAYLKDRWHRAYLTRMLAQTRAESARPPLIHQAEAALADYRTRARQLGTNEDSIAVLEAYFAALDGKRDAALRAAKKVNPAKDDDLEDLYLVVVGLEAGGDHVAAEAVRERMRQPGDVHLSRPIMLRWLDQDAKAPGDEAFTPWHPGFAIGHPREPANGAVPNAKIPPSPAMSQ